LSNSIFAETAQGLSDGLQDAGYELLIASTSYSLEREEQLLRALLGWHPAAVVVTGRRHSPATLKLLVGLKAAGTPVIEIWDHHPPAPGTQRARRSAPRKSAARGGAPAGPAIAGWPTPSGVAEDYRAHDGPLSWQRRATPAQWPR
jgi:LacI family gluconate utilization system Gnt-I transcriptional repressor